MAAVVAHSGSGRGFQVSTIDTSGDKINSAATGSTFIIGVNSDPSVTLTGVSDSVGNSYVQFGADQLEPTGGGGTRLRLYKCENGVGGTGHYATANFGAATWPTMFLLEVLDTGNIVTVDTPSIGQASDSSSPYTVTSGTFDAATTLALLFAADSMDGNAVVKSESTGFAKVIEEQDNDHYWTGAAWSKAVSSTSALTPSVTQSGGTSVTGFALMVFGLKSAAAGGITGAGQIASAEAFGAPTIDAGVAAAGVASAQAFGAPVVSAAVAPAGIASAQAFGTPVISAGIAPAGIASAGAVGTPALGAGITAVGIASAQALGAPTVAASVFAAGIASAEAVGTPALAAGIGAAGIASGEAFGAPVVGGTGIFAAGIPSAEAFGSPALAAAINASGIASGEAFGAPTIGTPSPPATRLGGFEMVGPREVSFKPLSQRILEARTERRVKPAKERAARRAKAIEVEAAFVALDTGNEESFRALMAQWLAQRPVMPPAVEPSALFLAQVLFRIQQMQAEQALRARLRAQRDEEEALIALLLI